MLCMPRVLRRSSCSDIAIDDDFASASAQTLASWNLGICSSESDPHPINDTHKNTSNESTSKPQKDCTNNVGAGATRHIRKLWPRRRSASEPRLPSSFTSLGQSCRPATMGTAETPHFQGKSSYLAAASQAHEGHKRSGTSRLSLIVLAAALQPASAMVPRRASY